MFMEWNSDFANCNAAQPSTFPCDGNQSSLQSYTHSVGTWSEPLNLPHGNIQPLDYNVHHTAYKESGAYEDGSPKFDEYLTNIEWLGRLSCNSLFPEVETNGTEAKSVKAHRSRLKERPPKSYFEIIQLAINSTAAKKMTLKQIYAWVEEHFPYYRHRAKPGWKNCIRQTLSIHDVFVRQTEENNKICFWTIKAHSDPNDRLQTLQREQPSSLLSVNLSGNLKKDSQKPERKEKRIKPILPRGSTSILIPVFISPALSTNVPQSSQSKNTKLTPIAPKLLTLLQNQNVFPKDCLYTVKESSIEKSATWKVTEPQRIVAKRWKRYSCQRPNSRRKRKLKLCPQNDSGHPALEADLNLLDDSNTSKMIQLGGTPVTLSPLKTPTKRGVLEGLSTSTPCKDKTSVLSPASMLISLLPELTPPNLDDSVLDFSLLKSPNDGSLGYISMGFPENTPMTFEPGDSEKDVGLLGFTPLQGDSFTETFGVDQQNESFTKLFSDFSLPNLDEGIDMANISW